MHQHAHKPAMISDAADKSVNHRGISPVDINQSATLSRTGKTHSILHDAKVGRASCPAYSSQPGIEAAAFRFRNGDITGDITVGDRCWALR